MTIENLIQEVKETAEHLDLVFRHGADNRIREKVYRRYYLMEFLRKHKLTLSEIGDIFKLTHCTVVYGLKQAHWMRKDNLYLRMTDDLRQQFEQYKALDYPLKKNIIVDIMRCNSYWEVRKIQDDIREGMYGDVTM